MGNKTEGSSSMGDRGGLGAAGTPGKASMEPPPWSPLGGAEGQRGRGLALSPPAVGMEVRAPGRAAIHPTHPRQEAPIDAAPWGLLCGAVAGAHQPSLPNLVVTRILRP